MNPYIKSPLMFRYVQWTLHHLRFTPCIKIFFQQRSLKKKIRDVGAVLKLYLKCYWQAGQRNIIIACEVHEGNKCKKFTDQNSIKTKNCQHWWKKCMNMVCKYKKICSVNKFFKIQSVFTDFCKQKKETKREYFKSWITWISINKNMKWLKMVYRTELKWKSPSILKSAART